MKTRGAVLLAAACALFVPAGAAEPLPAAAQRILDARFAGWAVESRSVGALRAPGARDLALVLARADAPQTQVVAVLLDDGHGGWRFSKASGAIDVGVHGEALTAKIGDGGLVVRSTAPGAEVVAVTSWRFALRAGTQALRLVGLEVERVSAGGGEPGWRDLARTDLTTGVRRETMDDVIGGRKRHREHEVRLPVRQPILFEEFTFDTRGLAAEAQPRFEPAGRQR
jgi:hypothetical protein